MAKRKKIKKISLLKAAGKHRRKLPSRSVGSQVHDTDRKRRYNRRRLKEEDKRTDFDSK